MHKIVTSASTSPHHFPPSRASRANMFSDLLSETGVLGKNGAWRRGPACDPNVEAVSTFQTQLAICARVVAGPTR